MAFDSAWLKSHWYYIVGGVVAFFVLYELIKTLGAASGGGGGGQPDLSSGMPALVGGVDAANAQYNAQIATAQIAGEVASNQAVEALQATEATVAGQVAVGLAQTQAARDVAITQSNNAVTTQGIVTGGQVEETGIIGQTIATLGAQKETVQLHSIDTVAAQIKQIQDHSKHASQDYGAFAPIVALETGQGGAAPGLAQANTEKAVGTAQVEGGVATSVVSGLTKVLTGFFG